VVPNNVLWLRLSYMKKPLTMTARGFARVVPERGIEPPTFSLRSPTAHREAETAKAHRG